MEAMTGAGVAWVWGAAVQLCLVGLGLWLGLLLTVGLWLTWEIHQAAPGRSCNPAAEAAEVDGKAAKGKGEVWPRYVR